MNPFYEQIYAVVRQIPYGKVVSYGQISWMLGRPRSAREVGRAMRCCKQNLPCHRVVMADGSISGGMFADIRKHSLVSEGVAFLPDGRVDMESFRWDMQGLII
jgi:methylated-DNA-protein-cysteine methyltransferase-like protein